MNWKLFGICLCGAIGSLCLMLGAGAGGGGNLPPAGDTVAAAFAVEQQLYRDAMAATAKQLRAGTLTEERAVQEQLESYRTAGRRQAFEAIAKRESEVLKDWTAEKHAELLESYSR